MAEYAFGYSALRARIPDTYLRNRDTDAIDLLDKRNAAMSAAKQRVKKYRTQGGAADLVRVEVLVPPADRSKILKYASALRAQHRAAKDLGSLYDDALRAYRAKILDNVDLDRLPDLRSRAAVVARALMERGDARAFAMGRQILDRVTALAS
jgi:hypothetical protein